MCAAGFSIVHVAHLIETHSSYCSLGNAVEARMRERNVERRSEHRIPLAIPVFVRGLDREGKEFLEFCSVLDISARGASLEISKNLSLSSRVSLEIPSASVPRFTGLLHSTRKIQARVVRVNYLEDCCLCGLRFSRPVAR